MPTPDLLTLIRRACEGTAAEALDPYLTPGAAPTPWCDRACPHYRGPTSCNAAPGTIMEDVCDPAVEALARLALSQAAEVERLTAELAAATANPSILPLVWRRVDGQTWELLSADGERSFGCAVGPVACQAMARGWADLGNTVPPHPLGWDVGVVR